MYRRGPLARSFPLARTGALARRGADARDRPVPLRFGGREATVRGAERGGVEVHAIGRRVREPVCCNAFNVRDDLC